MYSMVSQGNSLGFKFRVSQETLQKEIFMNPNNTEYIANNWLKESATNSIQLIEAKGGAIALMQSGEILYRLSRAAPFIKSKNHKMVGVALSSFVGKEVLILSTSKKPLDNEECITITPQDLKLVVDEIFDPFIKKEFIEQEDGLYKINRFKPSDYMELKPRYNPSEDIQKGAIIALILHLAQYNEEYAEWIINWLLFSKMTLPLTTGGYKFANCGNRQTDAGIGRPIVNQRPAFGESITIGIIIVNNNSAGEDNIGDLPDQLIALTRFQDIVSRAGFDYPGTFQIQKSNSGLINRTASEMVGDAMINQQPSLGGFDRRWTGSDPLVPIMMPPAHNRRCRRP